MKISELHDISFYSNVIKIKFQIKFLIDDIYKFINS